MGFHTCEYCLAGGLKPHTSSGDVVLEFESGNKWVMPDMIVHYVEDHRWVPPKEFIDDVMNSSLVGGRRFQTKGLPEQVGYLSGNFNTGFVPDGFVSRLREFLAAAEKFGSRRQTRGCIL